MSLRFIKYECPQCHNTREIRLVNPSTHGTSYMAGYRQGYADGFEKGSELKKEIRLLRWELKQERAKYV